MKIGRMRPAPAGAGKSIRNAVFEMDFIADVRRRLKLDEALQPNTSKTDTKQAGERIAQIKKLITAFGDHRLNETYIGFACSLCDAAATSDLLNIHRGRIEIWAASIGIS